MQDYVYSLVAVEAMALHLIINSRVIMSRGKLSGRGAQEYNLFLWGVFAYYITDAAWGLFAGLGWTRALYVDTMLYFIAIAVSVLMWCNFAITYLRLGKWMGRTLKWFGYALMTLYVVALTANVFNNCIFYFNEQGHYVAGPLRLLIFFSLVALNVPMAFFALLKTLGSQGYQRRRFMVVLIFCLTMMVATSLQILWPLWPFYALGCLFGNSFLHVFVVEEEHDEMRRAVIEHEQTEKHMAELEKALVRARAAEKARSMFFSIVSHDIRTPLNAILGYSELLKYGVKSQAERDEALESICASGTTLLQLVNDVLDLAKMDAGKMTLRPEPMKLSKLTDDVFASFRLDAAKKGLELVNRTEAVPAVIMDEHRLRQILFNLIGNAVKFTDSGTVTVAASYSGTTLDVSVSDTGCGIAPEMLTRILDPFVQVEDASHMADRAIGTGLGLSICRSLVEVMGGELVVQSELGKGSTFTAHIPGVAATDRKDKDAVQGATAQKPAALKKMPRHVLVVDDSPVNRSVLTAFLKRAGVVNIDQAADGEEGLAELCSAINAGNPHDFVFSDFWMPNMNGIEFVEKLRADPRFSRLPVFALTADTETHNDERTKLFSGIILKPMTYAKLIEVFSKNYS